MLNRRDLLKAVAGALAGAALPGLPICSPPRTLTILKTLNYMTPSGARYSICGVNGSEGLERARASCAGLTELASEYRVTLQPHPWTFWSYTPPPFSYAPITFLPTDRSEHGQPQVDDGEAPEPTAQEEV